MKKVVQIKFEQPFFDLYHKTSSNIIRLLIII